MMYEVVKYGDPVLEQRCAPVTEFNTPELNQFIADMFETMYASRGVGLAAPQVGKPIRLTVIDTSAGEEGGGDRLVLINPEIVAKSGSQTGEEGCLSIPGFREDVTRAKWVKVRAQNALGETFEVEGTDLLARAMQHEADHLDGILFLKYLSPLKRDLIRRKIKKLQKAGEW
jgi:peptide deformylase